MKKKRKYNVETYQNATNSDLILTETTITHKTLS